MQIRFDVRRKDSSGIYETCSIQRKWYIIYLSVCHGLDICIEHTCILFYLVKFRHSVGRMKSKAGIPCDPSHMCQHCMYCLLYIVYFICVYT